MPYFGDLPDSYKISEMFLDLYAPRANCRIGADLKYQIFLYTTQKKEEAFLPPQNDKPTHYSSLTL